MDNPKVTLLRPEWCDFTLVFGKRRYVFVGGEARAVPEAVALALRRKKDRKGKPMFDIDTPAPKKEKVEVASIAEPQNELGDFKQRSLLECLS